MYYTPALHNFPASGGRPEYLQALKKTGKVLPDPCIGVESQCEDTLRTCQSAGAVQPSRANGIKLLEGPQWGAIDRAMPAWRGGGHLQFASQVVSKQSGQQVQFVAASAAHRYIVHLAIPLEFAEDVFLAAAALVKGHHIAGLQVLVGDDDLEVVAVLVGDKQVQLDGVLVLAQGPGPDEEEPEGLVPHLGLPVGLEVGHLEVDPAPAQTCGFVPRRPG
jgi:hypothetical protein